MQLQNLLLSQPWAMGAERLTGVVNDWLFVGLALVRPPFTLPPSHTYTPLMPKRENTELLGFEIPYGTWHTHAHPPRPKTLTRFASLDR